MLRRWKYYAITLVTITISQIDHQFISCANSPALDIYYEHYFSAQLSQDQYIKMIGITSKSSTDAQTMLRLHLKGRQNFPIIKVKSWQVIALQWKYPACYVA